MMKIEAVIYARYSSSAQKEESIEQQVNECKRFADSKGLHIIHIYADNALTGRTTKRPEFIKMIDDSKRKEFKYVITYKNDRFARNRKDSAIYKAKLVENGVKMLYAAETIPDSPEGIILESVLEGLAEYYSVNLSQNVTRGMRDNAFKAKCNGKLPFGYRKGSDGKIVLNNEEAEILKGLFEWVGNGFTVAHYANMLNSCDMNKPNGKKVGSSMFYHSLRNERYTGIYIYDDIRIEGALPEIVSAEQFGKVQKILDARTHRNRNHLFLLTGKLYCDDCGSPIVGVSGTSGNGNKYFYYRCTSGKDLSESCSLKYIPKRELESRIKNIVLSETLKENFIPKLIRRYDLDDNQKKELEESEGLLLKNQHSIEKIIQAIEDGCYTQRLNIRIGELEQSAKLLKERIYELKIQSPVISDIALADELQKMAYKAQNNNYFFKLLLNKIVKRIFCDDENTSVEYGLF